MIDVAERAFADAGALARKSQATQGVCVFTVPEETLVSDYPPMFLHHGLYVESLLRCGSA